MERYIIVTRSNGYCGCDSTECYIFPEGTTNEEIDKYIEEGMYDYAESYEYVARGWDEDWEDEDEAEAYYNECCFDWHDATEEEKEDYEGIFMPVE